MSGDKAVMGVFFRDEIGEKHKMEYYVINLGDSVSGGTHWIVMNIKRDNWILRQFWFELYRRGYKGVQYIKSQLYVKQHAGPGLIQCLMWITLSALHECTQYGDKLLCCKSVFPYWLCL